MPSPDKIQENSGLIDMEAQVFNVVKDLRERIENLYDRYLTEKKAVPPLPSFEELSKNSKLHYDTSVKLAECIDEILEMKMRVGMVYKQLSDIYNTQISDRSSYNFLNNFKKNIEKYMSELEGYRFDLVDILKNTNNKFRILDSLSYRGE